MRPLVVENWILLLLGGSQSGFVEVYFPLPVLVNIWLPPSSVCFFVTFNLLLIPKVLDFLVVSSITFHLPLWVDCTLVGLACEGHIVNLVGLFGNTLNPIILFGVACEDLIVLVGLLGNILDPAILFRLACQDLIILVGASWQHIGPKLYLVWAFL